MIELKTAARSGDLLRRRTQKGPLLCLFSAVKVSSHRSRGRYAAPPAVVRKPSRSQVQSRAAEKLQHVIHLNVNGFGKQRSGVREEKEDEKEKRP